MLQNMCKSPCYLTHASYGSGSNSTSRLRRRRFGRCRRSRRRRRCSSGRRRPRSSSRRGKCRGRRCKPATVVVAAAGVEEAGVEVEVDVEAEVAVEVDVEAEVAVEVDVEVEVGVDLDVECGTGRSGSRR